MHTSAAPDTIMNSGSKFFKVGSDEHGETALFFGVQLEFPKAFANTLDIHNYFMETYFDEMGSSGYYWMMGEKFKGDVTRELGYSVMQVPKGAVKASTTFNKDSTTVQVTLKMDNPECIDEECRAVAAELNEYKAAGYITGFQQYWLY